MTNRMGTVQRRRWWQRGGDMFRVGLSGRLQYAIAPLAAALLVALYLRPWAYPAEYVFGSGVDSLWQQAVFQMHADGGLWGATNHLSFPVGANAWRLPQLGALVGAFAWVGVGGFGLGTAQAVLWYLVLVAGLNAVAMVFLLRGLAGQSSPLLVLAWAISLSASVFVVSHQVNLASFYPIPVVLGVLLKCTAEPRRPTLWMLLFLATVGLVAPMWWVVVLVLVIPVATIPFLLRRRWRESSAIALVWGALCVGILVQAAAHTIASRRGPGADSTREMWTSNYFPGHFSDLLVGTPLVRRMFAGAYARVSEGSSVDLAFGAPVVLGALAVVVLLVALPPRRTRSGMDTSLLSSLSIVLLLYWLGGGLGNLQAALAGAFGVVSPARVWYRMILPLAVVGAGWTAALLRSDPRANGTSASRWWNVGCAAAAIGLVGLTIADLAVLGPRPAAYGAPDAAQPDLPVFHFLRATTDSCAIAQFPNEAIPNGVLVTGIIDPRTYRGMLPYVVAPEFLWTAGSFDPEHPDQLARVSTEITDDVLIELRNQGYCAVLFDRALGELARDQGAELSGRAVRVRRAPDFEDDRYQLFLLE